MKAIEFAVSFCSQTFNDTLYLPNRLDGRFCRQCIRILPSPDAPAVPRISRHHDQDGCEHAILRSDAWYRYDLARLSVAKIQR